MADNAAGFWTIRRMSIANPDGAGKEDIPKLLRSLATSLELKAQELGPLYIQDITYEVESDESIHWPSLTVFYDTKYDDEE